MSGIDTAVDAAYRAGFRDANLVTVVAIAGPESGYDPTLVFNGNPGQTNPEHSVGLWQINLLAHPQYDEASMKDPFANASAAFTLSNGGSNFSPWTTYGDGKYLLYKVQATAAVRKYMANVINGGGASGGVGALPNLGDTQACIGVCNNNFPTSLDASDPNNATMRSNCINSCVGSSNNAGVQSTEADILLPCSKCAWNDITPCFSCAAAYLTKGLVSVGINLGFAVLVLIGLYLLFRPEIHAGVTKVVKVGKDAAIAAAAAA